MSQRRQFLDYFFRTLKNTDYALLKFIYSSTDELPETSDIDIAIHIQDRKEILNIILRGQNIAYTHVYEKSFVLFVSILFKDDSYLEIDLINRFDRKGIIYLEADELIDNAVTRKDGLKVASDNHNFEYIMLFYHCNGADVPLRYREYFSTFSFQQRTALFTYLTSRYKVTINTLDDLYRVRTRFARKIQTSIQQYDVNRQPLRFVNKLRYKQDAIRDIVYNRGITITFSGVDGAGKSTVLEKVNETLQKKYRQRTVVLRHRPELLPILSSLLHGRKKAEKRAKETLPRQGKNTGYISSLVRFLYYYTDYVLGQFYVYLRYTLRGYTVLYDRYYFDFIVDHRRSNMELPGWLTRLFYRLIFKPEVNIFLYADADVIRARKQELSSEDILTLTNGYRNLFEALSKKSRQQYIAINNINLEETLQHVMKACVKATIM